MKKSILVALLSWSLLNPNIIISQQFQTIQQEVASYNQLLKRISEERNKFKERYQNAQKEEERQKIIEESREYIFNSLTKEIFPRWEGTKYGFYGTTKTPKEGKIACGYFVSNTLEAVGLEQGTSWGFDQEGRKVRVRMGMLPAGDILRNFSDRGIRTFSNTPISKIEKEVIEMGRGVYIVGLDCHAGFLVYDGKNRPQFIHSSYYDPPYAVVSENFDTVNPLNNSNYRIFGNILKDERLIKKWIKEEKVEIQKRYNYFRRK